MTKTFGQKNRLFVFINQFINEPLQQTNIFFFILQIQKIVLILKIMLQTIIQYLSQVFITVLLTATLSLLIFYRYFKTSKLFINRRQQRQNQNDNQKNHYYELTILLGSGGHTGELSLMLKNLHFHKLNKLNILITSNDNSSKGYFENLLKEEILNQKLLKNKIIYHKVSRTNQVKQNYLTAVFTTIKSLIHSVKLIRNHLLNTTHFVANGPGTCVPFFFLFFVLNKLKLTNTKLIFIESWCRVTTISLSGKIVRYFADKFLVHWEEQKLKYPWTEYQGKML